MRGASGTLPANSLLPGIARFRAPEEQRASGWEWVQTAFLTTNLVWTTLCLGGFRPETMLVTLVLTSGLLLAYFSASAAENRPVQSVHWAGWCTIPFLLYAFLNVLTVTPVPWLGWMDWSGWANMTAVFWVTLNGIRSVQAQRILLGVMAMLGVVAVVLASYQRFVLPGWLMMGRQQAEQFLGRASGPFGIPNSLAGFLLLLLPAAGALAFRRNATATERVWWGWLTLVFLFGLLLTVSRGGWIALALALAVWPLIARWGTWQRRGIAALAVVIVSAGAGVLLHEASAIVRERLEHFVRDSGELSRPVLWRAAAGIIREHPIVGSGAGSYNVAFERYRPERFVDTPQWAHNEYLNTLSDYGAPGLVLLIGGVAIILIRRRRIERATMTGTLDGLNSPFVREGLAIGILAFALQAFVDFHFKIPALAMAFAVIAALALGRHPLRQGISRTSRPGLPRVLWLSAAALVLVMIFPVTRLYRAEALRYRARQAMDQWTVKRGGEGTATFLRAENDLRHATMLAPRHAGAWSDLAYALELRAGTDLSQIAALADPAVKAASRATQLSDVVPEFWIRLGVALAMQSRHDEAGKAFERSLQLAPRKAEGWYYYAYHLSFDTKRRDGALRAIATCLSLDPGNAAAEALQVKLNERPSGAPFNP